MTTILETINEMDKSEEICLDMSDLLFALNIRAFDGVRFDNVDLEDDFNIKSFMIEVHDRDTESGQPLGPFVVFRNNVPIAIGLSEYESYMIKYFFNEDDTKKLFIDICERCSPAYEAPSIISINAVYK